VGGDELVRESNLVEAQKLGRLSWEVGLVTGVDSRSPFGGRGVQEQKGGPAAGDGEVHAGRAIAAAARHEDAAGSAVGVGDQVGEAVAALGNNAAANAR
jgi:hypothetical protein